MSVKVVFLPAQQQFAGKSYEFTTNVHTHAGNVARHGSYKNLINHYPVLAAATTHHSYPIFLRFHFGHPDGFPTEQALITPDPDTPKVCMCLCVCVCGDFEKDGRNHFQI
jgi:hypothetical protein